VILVPRSLPVPEVEREQLLQPPLKAMLGQVRFPPILRLSQGPGALAPLQDELGPDFPQFAEEQQVTLQLGVDVALRSETARTYRFSAADGAWSVVVAPGAVTLEASADQYTSYEAFRERFERVWRVVLEHLRPAQRMQQGLRYIDHIERDLPAAGWTRYVNPELLGLLANEGLADRVRTTLTDLRFELDAGQLSFKHGIAQAGPANAWGYLLDFDYFNAEVSNDLSLETVLGQFDTFHDELYALFRWCVTNDALEEFRGHR
jgi:uncharacterized protein (TIGR04255 family)